jgi:hypothetical protein
MTNAYSASVSGTATCSRKSSEPDTTNTPTTSGSSLNQSRNASMFSRDGGRIVTAVSAWT